MKNKKNISIIPILVLLIFLSGSIPAGGFQSTQQENQDQKNTMEFTYQFSFPEIKENSDGIGIHQQGTNQYLMNAGAPVLPIYIQTIEYPLGTRITDVQYSVSSLYQIQLSDKITPALKIVIKSTGNGELQPVQNPGIYNADQYYPDQWFSYRLSGGLNKNNQHTTFLTIEIHPTRYNPIQDTIQSISSITLSITSKKPINPFQASADEHEMVIICYDKYEKLLEPLATHKNNLGIDTIVVPLKDIYDGTYFTVQGVDDQEKIKYFIKDALENWNITYVMLVGNYKQVPVRFSALETDTGGQYEELDFVTDLYYSDIYDSEGNFSSWDTNANGIYGEWPYPQSAMRVDSVDLLPDVYVGRLACWFGAEVKTVVNKIIDYETTTQPSDWFNHIVVTGGDTFDKSWEGGTDYNEGEEATAKGIEYLPEFSSIRLWTSLENLSTETIQTEISKGAGFLYMVGHGNPRNWATHSNGDYANWTGSFNNKNMWKLSNKGMYPILMVGGCHNSRINVGLMDIVRGLLTDGFHYFSYDDPMDLGGFWYSNWIPECWGWAFVRVPNGGAIASMGSTGYGGVSIGDSNHNSIPDCTEDMDGWFETQFFRLFNEDHIDMLGQTYGQLINDYAHTFPVYTDRYESKILETHILLGDPSLKIGGYE